MHFPPFRLRPRLTIRSLMVVIAVVAFGIALVGASRHAWRHHAFCLKEAKFAGGYAAMYVQEESRLEAAARNQEKTAERYRELRESVRKDFAARKERDLKGEKKLLDGLQHSVEFHVSFAKDERQRAVDARRRAEEWASIEHRFRRAVWRPWTRIDRLEVEIDRNIEIEEEVVRLEQEERKRLQPEIDSVLKEIEESDPSR